MKLYNGRVAEFNRTVELEKRIAQLEAENERLHFELQQHHEQSKYVVKKLETESAKLREAALLYSSDIGHSHACKATSKTVGVCICGYDALAALVEDKDGD